MSIMIQLRLQSAALFLLNWSEFESNNQSVRATLHTTHHNSQRFGGQDFAVRYEAAETGAEGFALRTCKLTTAAANDNKCGI